ncbi:MAG: hypothetical protein PHR33_01745 [Bacilli bacterium]|nr:hypothetical protein [Bacilli bacterium]
MISEKIYAAIDIGEWSSKLVIGTVNSDKFNICAIFSTETQGISSGDVSSKNEIQRTVISLLEKAKEMDFDIKKLIIVLPSNNMNVYRKKASNSVTSVNKVVSSRDIELLKNACASHQIMPGEMVIGIYPIQYSLDGENVGEEPPIGYRGNVIELDSFVVSSPQSLAKGIVDAIQELEIEILDVIPLPIALFKALVKEQEGKSGILIADLGAAHNSVSFFYKNLFCGHRQGKTGGNFITSELANFLDNDKKQAEIVKVKYGSANLTSATNIEVYKNKTSGKMIKEKEIVEIVDKSLDIIIDEVAKSILYLTKNNHLPIILTGGVANTENIQEKFKLVLSDDFILRKFDIVGGNDASYYACFGAIISYIEKFSKIERELSNV